MKVTITAGVRIFIGIAFILSLLGGGISTARADLPTDLFFSEYTEGTSFNKAVEIFNGTGASIDLGTGVYTLELYSNGSPIPSQTMSLSGTISNGDVFVVTHPNADVLIPRDATSSTVINFNGDDAIALKKGGVLIDVIGQIGSDPGTEWGTGLTSTADNTIRRKSSICTGDPIGTDAFDPSVEWDGYAISTWGGFGAHTANCTPADIAPTVATTSPLINATGVAINANVIIIFSEPVNVGANAFNISCDSGVHAAAVSGGPITFTLNPATDFNYNEDCVVTVASVEVSDQDTNDPPDNMVSDYVFGFTTQPLPTLVINEIDYDQTITPDGAEFIEIKNVSSAAIDLNGYLVRIINGTGGGSSIVATIPLPAVSLAAGDYYVICGNAANTANCDLDVSPDTDLIQNGAPDAVALFSGEAIIDTVSYEGNRGAPYTEGSGSGLEETGGGSLSRCPDGVDTNQNNVDLKFTPAITPGIPNDCGAPVNELCGDAMTPIYNVQGSGPASPLASTTVSVQGVVVGDFQNNASADNGDLNGFHLQDPVGDGNPLTSDGIFIFAPGGMDVAVGDTVRVRGFVSEYYDLTEITASQIWKCPAGGSVSATILNLPVTSLDMLEAREGMLVTFPQPLVISEYFEYDRYGEILLTSKRHITPTALVEPGAPAIAKAAQFLLDRITLDDGRGSQNPDPAIHPDGTIFDLTNLFRGGDLLWDVTGVLDYAFGEYRIQPTKGAIHQENNPRPAAPNPVGGSLRVVSMNVLNYFVTLDSRGANTAEEFTRQRDKIIAAIITMNPDIAGLVEIENNDAALDDLIAGLNAAAGAGTYNYIRTGPIGGDAIKVALIYKPATVAPLGKYAILNAAIDPRFISTLNRPVLAQTFVSTSGGGVFTVAVNHLKSKGSECLGDPDLGDGQGNCNLTRVAAAQAEVDWLASDPTGSKDPDFLIIGDLNSYDKEDPIDAFKAGADDVLGTDDDFVDMLFNFEGENAYSYVFDGQIGYLDYAASKSLVPRSPASPPGTSTPTNLISSITT